MATTTETKNQQHPPKDNVIYPKSSHFNGPLLNSPQPRMDTLPYDVQGDFSPTYRDGVVEVRSTIKNFQTVKTICCVLPTNPTKNERVRDLNEREQ